MAVTKQTGTDHAALWNGAAGRAWLASQDLLDRTLRPFEDLLVQAVSATSATRVLDVGCGTGATTVAVARQLGAMGRSTGIDISDPVIAAARARAEREGMPVSFICADAQSHPFERAGFDMIVSRFGVMFFKDSIQAFENLRSSTAENGQLRFIAWRSVAENPFMTTAERAAAPLLTLPAREPDTPGPFYFADPLRVQSILKESGWTEVDIRPLDVICSFPEEQLVAYFTTLGPVGLALQEAGGHIREQVIEMARPAFDPYVCGSDVRFTAACWMVSARAR